MHLLTFFTLGFFVGFSIVSTPGPSLLFFISESAHRGWRSGIAVILSQIFADLFVIIPIAFVLQATPRILQSILGFIGALYLMQLGFKTLKAEEKNDALPPIEHAKSSFMRGLTVHLLNPFVYILWASAGGAFMLNAHAVCSFFCSALFPLGFWSAMLFVEGVFLIFIELGKKPIHTAWYRFLVRASGMLLILAGACLLLSTFQLGF
ncbi:MAG: LysE family transporter [Candidatus Micrarchaeia archaeon]